MSSGNFDQMIEEMKAFERAFQAELPELERSRALRFGPAKARSEAAAEAWRVEMDKHRS